MKKLLIVNNNMYIGGVQKALINLLNCIHDRYDVTLLLFWNSGDYIDDIPKNVKVITANSAYRYIGMAGYETKGRPIKFIVRNFWAVFTRIFGRTKALKIMGLGQKKLSGYDVTISYMQNGAEKLFYGGCNDFVLRHVEADKKIAFLHCDFEKCGAATEENRKMYSRFDMIAACSDGCAATFRKAYPELADKLMTVVNCHDFDRISALSEAEPRVDDDRINILTVSRLGAEKGVLRGVKAYAALDELRSKARYYIIGDGVKRKEITDYISDHDLKDDVILLGELKNPYGYMKTCDLLLIPSYSEGAPMIIGEAAYLGIPILSTRTSSADDMIKDTGYGWVCDNSTEALALSLSELISRPELIHDRKKYLSDYVFSNDTAISQFSRLI